jgi:alpha-ribazole phosphatase
MITYKLHLIRHGETEGNRKKICVGARTDLPLAPEGAEELRALTAAYRYPSAAKVYTSPMLRCRQPAEILFPDAEIEQVEGLRECDLGEFEGRPFAELNKEEAFLQWLEGKSPPPGGEGPQALGNRITEAFEFILNDMMRCRIAEAAAVTHGAILMGLLSMYGYPKAAMKEWAVENGCGYTVMTSAAMWMRDRCFEIVSAVPFGGAETEGESEVWNLEER